MAALLNQRFGWEVTADEVLYLALHVARLTDDATSTTEERP